jgi:hypothetical protein
MIRKEEELKLKKEKEKEEIKRLRISQSFKATPIVYSRKSVYLPNGKVFINNSARVFLFFLSYLY